MVNQTKEEPFANVVDQVGSKKAKTLILWKRKSGAKKISPERVDER